METFPNEEGLLKRLNPFDYNEDILLLEEELRIEFWRLAEENLSDRQLQIIKGMAKGSTQTEIAKELSINQSSVVKNFAGNSSCKKTSNQDNKINSSGGSRAKLRALIDKDPKIQSILARIAAIRDESWI